VRGGKGSSVPSHQRKGLGCAPFPEIVPIFWCENEVYWCIFGTTAGCAKNDPTCFCQNFVKSPPNLIIFGLQIARTIELRKAYLLSTSRNLCQRTTV